MSLFLATFVCGLVLAGLGGLLAWNGEPVKRNAITWMRSKPVTWVLFGLATLWFLWHVSQLGKADFGSFKGILLLLFGATCFGSFFYVRELLAVRGAASLVLMGALPLLNAAYMQYDQPQRLFMVTVVYVLISVAIVVGAQPWRLRDFMTWLYKKPKAPELLGKFVAGYGALLLIVSLTY